MWGGAARNLSGLRYEHLRVLVDDEDHWSLFVAFAQVFARGDIPEETASALALGRLTALRKYSGRVRGIVAGSTLRRLVSRSLATQFSDLFLETTAPYQFALQTRTGTDAAGLVLRLLTDTQGDLVVISLGGLGPLIMSSVPQSWKSC